MAEIVQIPIRSVYKDGSIVVSNVKSKIDNTTTSYSVVNTWYDDSAMDDSKVDQFGIYSKYKPTGEYLRENKPQWGELFLEVDTVAELRDMTPYNQFLIRIGCFKGVRLSGYWVKKDTKKPIEYILTNSILGDDGGSIFQIGNLKLGHTFVGEVDVRYFGASGKITQNCYSYLQKAFAYAISNKVDLYHPTGVYNTFTGNFPYKTLYPDLESLFDCKYITIKGDGDSTVFMSETATGADVLNLHKIKKITIRDLNVTCLLTGNTRYGTNGISVVSGYDEINILNVSVSDLFGIQKESYTKVTNKGNWDASTNTPNLSNTNPGQVGDWYTVTVSGTQNFGGNTSFDFAIGDEVIFANGVFWRQSFYVDGGKALTLQNGESPLQLGSIKADIRVKNCAYAFGIDYLNHNFLNKKTSIDINFIAENCHRAVSLAGSFTPGIAAPLNKQANFKINGLATNCQEDIVALNVVGGDINVKVNTTKTAEERRKLPDGSRYWNIYDRKVTSIRALNVKNSNIVVTGDKGECDYKYELGGQPINANTGYDGITKNSNFHLNVSGNPIIPFNLVNSGGHYISNCVFNILSENLNDLPDLLFWSSRANAIIARDASYYPSLKANKVNLIQPDTKNNLGELFYSPTSGVTIKQIAGSLSGTVIGSFVDFNGNPKIRFLNDGRIQISNAPNDAFATLTVGGTVPEGVLAGESGDLYIRTGYASGARIPASIWFKQSVSGVTGWVRLDNIQASTTVLGLIKQAVNISLISTPNATDLSTNNTLTNSIKDKINELITKLIASTAISNT